MYVKKVLAYPIVNSKGDYTIEAAAIFSDGSIVTASAPQGTSTGSREALSLPVSQAVEIFNTQLPTLIIDSLNAQMDPKEFYTKLVYKDSTPNKHVLGANTFLVTEILYFKSLAKLKGMPTFTLISNVAAKPSKFPKLIFNVINGGSHALNTVPFQEFWVIPQTYDISESIVYAVTIYKSLKEVLKAKGFTTLTGLEGGFAPSLPHGPKQAFELIVEAIGKAGLKVGINVKLGLDIAATNFAKYNEQSKTYEFKIGLETYTTERYFQFLKTLTEQFPISIIEDPLPENASPEQWKALRDTLSPVKIIGDDLTTTNVEITTQMNQAGAIDGIIVKPNQVGSVIEAINVVKFAAKNNLTTIASHRSGDTNDPFIAEFAYGLGTDFLKSGAPAHGERVSKYNQLLRIYYKLYENN